MWSASEETTRLPIVAIPDPDESPATGKKSVGVKSLAPDGFGEREVGSIAGELLDAFAGPPPVSVAQYCESILMRWKALSVLAVHCHHPFW